MTPLQYFKLFWDNNILEYILLTAQNYTVFNKVKSLYKRMLKKSRCSLVSKWHGSCQNVPIQNVLIFWLSIRTSYHGYDTETVWTLRKFLHVNDDDSQNNPENSNDELFKMRPLLDLVINNCIKMKSHSIDEQTISAKMKRKKIKEGKKAEWL